MLAKMYGLAGQGIFEEAQADAIHAAIKDFVNMYISSEYIRIKASQDPRSKKYFKTNGPDVSPETLKSMYSEEFLPAVRKYFGVIEGFASRGTSDGFFLHSGVSYVDFCMACFGEFFYKYHPELMTMFPNTRAIVHRVSAVPLLQTYLKKRPKTKFLI